MNTAPKIKLDLGNFESDYSDAIAAAEAAKVSARLWAGDYSLWSDSAEEISNRLGWLDIAQRMSEQVEDLEFFAEEIRAADIKQVLLLGMGGSSLAPEVFSKMFGSRESYPSLSVLDSTDPEAVRAMQAAHRPAETLYIVSTKSGGTVETLSFLKTFYRQAMHELGADKVGAQFVAITDPESTLADLAEKYNFRRTFLSDANIGGRYSALSYFGLVPAALLGVNLPRLLQGAVQMAEACGANVAAADNPGIQLGLALSSLAKAGRDKVTFLSPKSIESFGDWAEQLIAESTGKAGNGILPVVGEILGSAEEYSDDRVFVVFELEGEEKLAGIDELHSNGHPVITIKWESVEDLGGHFFLWEFATAVAGYGLGIHPFNQPDVEAAKVQARGFVEAYAESGELPTSQSAALDSERLSAFLEEPETGSYVALQAYVHANDEVMTSLGKLRIKLRDKTGLATTLGIGPRFLHSTGQLHKGDAGKGLFVQFVSRNPDDLAIPLELGSAESEISYGVLKEAQALGDAKALRDAGRKVLTCQIEGDIKGQLTSLVGDYQ
jgi:glucose-6-phosphate isomerase